MSLFLVHLSNQLILLGFVLISVIIRKFYTKRVDGELGAMYLIYYGLIRIVMEPMREEAYIMRIFGNLSQSMLMSALFIALGIGIIVYLEINRKKLCCCKKDEGSKEEPKEEN